MKTFSEYITEVFDKPLEYHELPWIEPNTFVYVFQLDDKNYYRVFFMKPDKKNQYEIYFDHLDNESDIFDDRRGKTTVVSDRNSIKVLSTVSNIVKDFINKNKNITGFYFSASDESRGRKVLYDRLAKKLASSLKWKYEINNENNDMAVMYNISKYKSKK